MLNWKRLAENPPPLLEGRRAPFFLLPLLLFDRPFFFLLPDLPLGVEADSLPTYTMAELAEHKAYTWLAIRGKVYDVSFWLDKHPGCSSVLKKHAGGDATNIFTAVEHTPSAHAWLRGFLIGTVEG